MSLVRLSCFLELTTKVLTTFHSAYSKGQEDTGVYNHLLQDEFEKCRKLRIFQVTDSTLQFLYSYKAINKCVHYIRHLFSYEIHSSCMDAESFILLIASHYASLQSISSTSNEADQMVPLFAAIFLDYLVEAFLYLIKENHNWNSDPKDHISLIMSLADALFSEMLSDPIDNGHVFQNSTLNFMKDNHPESGSIFMNGHLKIFLLLLMKSRLQELVYDDRASPASPLDSVEFNPSGMLGEQDGQVWGFANPFLPLDRPQGSTMAEPMGGSALEAYVQWSMMVPEGRDVAQAAKLLEQKMAHLAYWQEFRKSTNHAPLVGYFWPAARSTEDAWKQLVTATCVLANASFQTDSQHLPMEAVLEASLDTLQKIPETASFLIRDHSCLVKHMSVTCSSMLKGKIETPQQLKWGLQYVFALQLHLERLTDHIQCKEVRGGRAGGVGGGKVAGMSSHQEFKGKPIGGVAHGGQRFEAVGSAGYGDLGGKPVGSVASGSQGFKPGRGFGCGGQGSEPVQIAGSKARLIEPGEGAECGALGFEPAAGAGCGAPEVRPGEGSGCRPQGLEPGEGAVFGAHEVQSGRGPACEGQNFGPVGNGRYEEQVLQSIDGTDRVHVEAGLLQEEIEYALLMSERNSVALTSFKVEVSSAAAEAAKVFLEAVAEGMALVQEMRMNGTNNTRSHFLGKSRVYLKLLESLTLWMAEHDLASKSEACELSFPKFCETLVMLVQSAGLDSSMLELAFEGLNTSGGTSERTNGEQGMEVEDVVSRDYTVRVEAEVGSEEEWEDCPSSERELESSLSSTSDDHTGLEGMDSSLSLQDLTKFCEEAGEKVAGEIRSLAEDFLAVALLLYNMTPNLSAEGSKEDGEEAAGFHVYLVAAAEAWRTRHQAVLEVAVNPVSDRHLPEPTSCPACIQQTGLALLEGSVCVGAAHVEHAPGPSMHPQQTGQVLRHPAHVEQAPGPPFRSQRSDPFCTQAGGEGGLGQLAHPQQSEPTPVEVSHMKQAPCSSECPQRTSFISPQACGEQAPGPSAWTPRSRPLSKQISQEQAPGTSAQGALDVQLDLDVQQPGLQVDLDAKQPELQIERELRARLFELTSLVVSSLALLNNHYVTSLNLSISPPLLSSDMHEEAMIERQIRWVVPLDKFLLLTPEPCMLILSRLINLARQYKAWRPGPRLSLVATLCKFVRSVLFGVHNCLLRGSGKETVVSALCELFTDLSCKHITILMDLHVATPTDTFYQPLVAADGTPLILSSAESDSPQSEPAVSLSIVCYFLPLVIDLMESRAQLRVLNGSPSVQSLAFTPMLMAALEVVMRYNNVSLMRLLLDCIGPLRVPGLLIQLLRGRLGPGVGPCETALTVVLVSRCMSLLFQAIIACDGDFKSLSRMVLQSELLPDLCAAMDRAFPKDFSRTVATEPTKQNMKLDYRDGMLDSSLTDSYEVRKGKGEQLVGEEAAKWACAWVSIWEILVTIGSVIHRDQMNVRMAAHNWFHGVIWHQVTNQFFHSISRLFSRLPCEEIAVVRARSTHALRKHSQPSGDGMHYWLIRTGDVLESDGQPFHVMFHPDSEIVRVHARRLGSLARKNERDSATQSGSSESACVRRADGGRTVLPPIPVGCWSMACVNLSGSSEAALKTRMCAHCRRARYCSVDCQREDWTRHRGECRHWEAALQS